ncbi:ATP-binding protein [Utexia brackfieldae]|uniref:ATP-binding protein n=1 Tax=Utexia brackfieldae TaxID=3074108 RepID=UPI00370D64B6
MPTDYKLIPSASSLSESMRDIGYSLATAIADIIDNSITAKATQVDIFCDLSKQDPLLIIIDNGHGMSPSDLILAMKHGAINPKVHRQPDDLGRFGLGMKTASFSQCRCLTVVSSINTIRSAAQWDLDYISEKDEWLLAILNEDEISAIDYTELLPQTGTAVIWQKLDRLCESSNISKRDEIVNEKLDLVGQHLSLVFHRYLSGEAKLHPKISIRINGHPITPFDPFCRQNKATQLLPKEIVRIHSEDVAIQPYVLPHHSKLTADEYDFYEDRSSFISNQGVYIYRNDRLMAWGDWFRLIPKGEATKLVRVQIDFPNALDESWTIDIKKSRVSLPNEVKDRLRQIISKVTYVNIRINRGRGQKLFQEAKAPVWERYSDQGQIRFELNLAHPLLDSLKKEMTESQAKILTSYLNAVMGSLPIEMIYSDYSSAPRALVQYSSDENTVFQQLEVIREALSANNKINSDTFRDIISSMRMFNDYPEISEKYIREKFSGN